ncbi:selenoprotein, putative [Ixodes scapularis]|uniref:Selenoprotein, putative n=1 Tax=Ixodes scapularis TaxID=6945 RepID=B7QN82_IXOSC|nr:selenoprotein, putative [Ixodes scapularis]|eukprot:XP_002400767.1 selenoprotein, putative [Ixodes scapularis]
MRGIVGRKTSFEVEINGVLVFSKLEKKGFPVFDEVAALVEEVSRGMPVRPLVGKQG